MAPAYDIGKTVRDVPRNTLGKKLLFLAAGCTILYLLHTQLPWEQGQAIKSVEVNAVEEEAILAQGDDVTIQLPCGEPFVMRGHNLGIANIRNEFAEDEYGICNADASKLEDGGVVVVSVWPEF